MKHINALTIILVIVAVAFVCVLIVAPGVIGLKSSDEKYVSAYFNPDTVNTVSITISDEDWADILANPTAEEYHKANIQINGDTYEGVGIRAKGMTSLTQVASSDSNRYSFKVKSDEYVGGQTFLGLNKFVLNNNYQDASYMKEYLSYQLLTELGVPTPAYAYAAIYINGEYWGLYLMVEAVEEDFAARNFGMDYGQLYKPETMNFGGGGGGHDIDKNKGERGGNMNRDMNQMMEEFNKLTEEEKEELFKNIKDGNFQGMTGQMNQTTDGTAPTMPEGMTIPTDGTAPTMPEGMTIPTNGTAPTMPEGMTIPTNGTAPAMPGGNNGGGGKMPNMPGGFGGSGGGADLVYTDDNASSYSQIFDNAVFSNVTNDDKNRVIKALKNLKEGTELEKYIDVDEVLRYFAVNTALVNLDSYVSSLKHNYYLYEEDGQLSMIPWDWNLSFGAFQASGSSAVNFPIDTPVTQGIELTERPMIGSLLAVDSYKNTYHEYLNKIATEFFGNSYEERINKIDAMIAPYVEKDPTAFYTYDQYKSGIEYLKIYGRLRAASILGQLNGTIPSTWDGQTADSSALIDSTELSKYSAGGMGGGGGMGGFGGGNKKTQTDGNNNGQTGGNNNGGGGTMPAQPA